MCDQYTKTTMHSSPPSAHRPTIHGRNANRVLYSKNYTTIDFLGYQIRCISM